MVSGWIKIRWIDGFIHTKILTMLSDEAIEIKSFKFKSMIKS